MSEQVIYLAKDFTDIKKPSFYKKFKNRKDVLLQMTGTVFNSSSNNNPIVLVYHSSTGKSNGPISTVLFLDNSSSGLYSLGEDEQYILESDDAPGTLGIDFNQSRYVFKYDLADNKYSYIGLFEAVTRFADKGVFLWKYEKY